MVDSSGGGIKKEKGKGKGKKWKTAEPINTQPQKKKDINETLSHILPSKSGARIGTGWERDEVGEV